MDFETGKKLTFQKDWKKKVDCANCKESKAEFVHAFREEGNAEHVNQNLICEMHKNTLGHFWPHDCIAVGLYLCRQCGKITALWNQA